MIKLKAVGHRVLVKPEVIEEVTTGGIYKPQQTVDAEKGAVDRGVVIDVGPDAYGDFPSKWCKIGDEIMWPRYAGKPILNTVLGDLHILNDEDVLCIVEKTNEC